MLDASNFSCENQCSFFHFILITSIFPLLNALVYINIKLGHFEGHQAQTSNFCRVPDQHQSPGLEKNKQIIVLV